MRYPCFTWLACLIMSTPQTLTEGSTKVTARYSERLPRTLCVHYKDPSMLGVPIKTPAEVPTNITSELCQIHWLGSLAPPGSRFSRRRCSTARGSDSSQSDPQPRQYYYGETREPEICENVTNLAAARPENLWPERTIYYRYEGYLSEHLQRVFNGGLDDIERWTCLRFKEYVTGQPSKDYVLVRRADGKPCQTEFLGRKGGVQTLDVGEECKVDGAGWMLRQLLRIVGVGPMHVRPDRNYHIGINWENIKSEHITDYCRSREDITKYIHFPYDELSTTHSGPRENTLIGDNVITSHNCFTVFGPSFVYYKVTTADWVLMNRMYKCSLGFNE